MSSVSLPAPATTPFDSDAARYDERFTERPLPRLLRARVWKQLDELFAPGDRVLELGCGTGEDALHLAERGVLVTAIDASTGMLEQAARKLGHTPARQHVHLAQLDLDQPAALASLPGAPFAGAFSSFGPLNCIADRRALAAALARTLRPHTPLLLVVMGPFCPWEIVSGFLRGGPRAAARRLRGPTRATLPSGAALAVSYPSPGALARELAPYFELRRASSLGLLLPPSDGGRRLERLPRLLSALDTIDRGLAHLPFAARAGDHFIACFSRTEAAAA
jgi:SAM-dependent methyltransferase